MNESFDSFSSLTPAGLKTGQQLLQESDSAAAESAGSYAIAWEAIEELQRMCDPTHINAFSLNELYDLSFPDNPPIIDGLLYTGTYLLAGAPKIGKSFLVAQIAYHVSTGQPLWDHPVQQSGVLYLALEDDWRRLQERMSRMFGVEGTDHLRFAIGSQQIDAGLDVQLDNFLHEHPGTRLVIIDTLQKVRAAVSDSYSYANDYEVIGQLKRFAAQRSLCLLLVHHTRKQTADDRFDTISGTNGLLGCADGAFLLRKDNRTSLTGTLDIVGRDQPDQRLHLTVDPQKRSWQLDHEETELWKPEPDPLLEQVAALITTEAPVWSGSAAELAALLGDHMKPNVLTRKLNVMHARLKNEYGISYRTVRSRNGSCITLDLAEQQV